MAEGEAAAHAAAQQLERLADSSDQVPVIFATGASPLETQRALTSIPNLPWKKLQGFHLDEYLGMDEDHPASFRRYLRENLTQRVPSENFLRSMDRRPKGREYTANDRRTDLDGTPATILRNHPDIVPGILRTHLVLAEFLLDALGARLGLAWPLAVCVLAGERSGDICGCLR